MFKIYCKEADLYEQILSTTKNEIRSNIVISPTIKKVIYRRIFTFKNWYWS
jgi:hypothetical protein